MSFERLRKVRTEFVRDAEDGRSQGPDENICVPKREAMAEFWREFKTVQLTICTPRQILLIL